MSDYEQSMTTNLYHTCCPYVGLAADRTIMLTGATSAHRCFVQAQIFAPDLNHQDRYCLTDNHVTCPFYAPRNAAPQTLEFVQPQASALTLVPLQAQVTTTFPLPQVQLPAAAEKSWSGFHLPNWFFRAFFVTSGLLLLVLLIAFVPKLLNFRLSNRSISLPGQTSIIVNHTEVSAPTALAD